MAIFCFQLALCLIFFKLNTSSEISPSNKSKQYYNKLIAELDSKLDFYKHKIYDLVPRTEALLRATNGDITSLLCLLSRTVSKSPLNMYKQLKLNDSKLLTYLSTFYKTSDDKNYSDIPTYSQTIPILIIACNRGGVERTLKQLIDIKKETENYYSSFHNLKISWPIVVSQGCTDSNTKRIILKYSDYIDKFMANVPDDIPNIHKIKTQFRGYYRISSHFKLAISKTFSAYPDADSIIVIEDDLDLSPDILRYFASTYRILKEDPTVYCVSAFNDNGRPMLINTTEHSKIYRTDFFPGLGWMLLRSLWQELEPDWPAAFWDDHMRTNRIRRSRSCLRPEISRTYTFGKIGVSNGQYFKKYLETIQLSRGIINFTLHFTSPSPELHSIDLSHLFREQYDYFLQNRFDKAQPITLDQLLTNDKQLQALSVSMSAVKLSYRDHKHFSEIAHIMGLMPDFRDNTSRTSYNGIVEFYWKNTIQVFLYPAFDNIN